MTPLAVLHPHMQGKLQMHVQNTVLELLVSYLYITYLTLHPKMLDRAMNLQPFCILRLWLYRRCCFEEEEGSTLRIYPCISLSHSLSLSLDS